MRLLESVSELVVQSGFVYVPLLFDADIDREARSRRGCDGPQGPSAVEKHDCLFEVGGKLFVKAVCIASILESYDRIDPDHYEVLRTARLRSLSPLPEVATLSPKAKLPTIIFQIMPHFIRKGRGFERKPVSDHEILAMIRSRIELPRQFVEQAGVFLESGPMLQRLQELDGMTPSTEPLQDGPISRETLSRWFDQALEAQILNREKARLLAELHDREGFDEAKKHHIAILFYLAARGSFELDGFGFERVGSRDDFLIYKRTGEYILQDYYARKYRFPDCRVAVSTAGALRPLVVETYKHPFLLGHAPRQGICLSGYEWPEEFTAENVINVLEAGITALLYGYDARKRNGYHSLDRTLNYIKTIEFDDYRIQPTIDSSTDE